MERPALFSEQIAAQLFNRLTPETTPGEPIKPGSQLMTAIMQAVSDIPGNYGSGPAKILKRAASGVSYVDAGLASTVTVINPGSSIATGRLFTAKREQMTNRWLVKSCSTAINCAIITDYIPPKAIFNGVEKTASQWEYFASTDVCCGVSVRWDLSSPLVLKRIFNYGDFCVGELTPQLWCTTAELTAVTLQFARIPCAALWYARMDAVVRVSMGHTSATYGGGTPVPPTCGPTNPRTSADIGFFSLSRDKLITSVAPTQTLAFTADDHYDGEFCDCPGYDHTVETSTTAYGYCGSTVATVTGPFNPTYLDLVDVDFDFDITT